MARSHTDDCDDEPKTIATSLETETGLESYQLVHALIDRRETELELSTDDGGNDGVDAIDRLLRQVDDTTAFAVLGDDELVEALEEGSA